VLIQPKAFAMTDYLNQTFECTCGRVHSTALREVVIRHGALEDVPTLVRRLGCTKPFILCDPNTWSAACERLVAIFDQAGMPYRLFQFHEAELVPDETALGRLVMTPSGDCDLIIGVGAGTINDLSKYFSFITGRPYCIVGTAPSMDGFASIGAALMRDNLKTTLDAHVPIAIVGDVDVLAAAPMEMILAGLGDILGKYTCLADWKISQIVNGEYYCDIIVEMVERSIQNVIDSANDVYQRKPAAISALMEALVLAGIAMSFSGNSRPASGCEHHLSHFLEMNFLFNGRKGVLHGRKVAVGTVTAALLYHKLVEEKIDFAAARRACEAFDMARWKADMTGYFGKAAPAVIALEASIGKNSPESCLKRLNAMEKHWPEIVAEIRKIPDARHLMDLLESFGAPNIPQDIGIERSLLRGGIIAAKEVRDRFTLWQILWDLDLLESYADWVSEYFYERRHEV
jgi:glycerol-1-phosphate dehydrogenase [NAD(P)+]